MTQKIKLVCVGKIKEDYLKEGIADFSKRISHHAKLEVIEIKDLGVEEEAMKILPHLHDSFSVALCVEGKVYNSMEFSKFLMDMEKPITFVIGSSEGISDRVKDRADLCLSISDMTFTHEMCRLFLVEQIYRAFTIIKGTPYHK